MRAALLILFVASTAFAGARRLLETARLGRDLAGLDGVESRRAMLFGDWYVAVQQLRRELPADATVDFILLRPDARDIAVLGAAELQPRDVRLFDGWEAWRSRTRAELLHDARAANAVPNLATPPAQFVVIVDPGAKPPLRLQP